MIAAWFFFLVAALLLLVILFNLKEQYALLRLPIVNGTMLRCTPQLGQIQTQSSVISHSSSNPVWTVDARFRYIVDGKTFERAHFANIRISDQVQSVRLDDPPPHSIAHLCELYAPGTLVAVHYRPEAPQHSFVYFSSPLWGWPWMLLPTFAALLGWFCLFCSRLA